MVEHTPTLPCVLHYFFFFQAEDGIRDVAVTGVQTCALLICTEPSGLKAFLPPLPTDLTTKQQNTVTVRTVRADGSADLENRFDRFDLESDLPEIGRVSCRERV